MGKRDFDNLNKTLRAALTIVAGATQSQELDFELPRGYVAKIWQVELNVIERNEDMEGLLAQEITAAVSMGVWSDPDEIVRVLITEASVVQEGLFDHQVEFFGWGTAAVGTGIAMDPPWKIITIPEHIDVLAFRNWRFNAVGGGADVAVLTECVALVIIRYTLEEVKDADILNLLDIL